MASQVTQHMSEIRKWRYDFDGPADATGVWSLYGSRGKRYAIVRAEGSRYRATALARRRRDLGLFDDLSVALGAARRETDVTRP